MKRLSNIVLLIVLTGLFSCDMKTEVKEDDDHHTAQKEMLESNRAVQRAIETGDSATLRKYMADDAVDHGGAPDGGDLKGEEIVRTLSSIHNDIDNLKFETIQEAANDDHVFALVHVTGTTNKAVWGMPAGFKMDSKSVDVIKVKDGKMVDHWSYFDMKEMMAMMGGVKPADGAPAMDTAQKK
jgi:predicted ester cyclase